MFYITNCIPLILLQVHSNSSSMSSQNLNVAAISRSAHSLGPGERAVIWVQGCPFHCQGCIAPDWIPFRPARLVSPEHLAEELLSSATISGITFSGGEPMQQAAGLAALARVARENRDLNIICFTGYRYEQLLKNPPSRDVMALLEQIDVLIDGPYVASRNDGIGLRGSSNQRIIHLTERLRTSDLEASPRQVEIHIEDGELAIVGIPPRGLQHTLNTAIQSLGAANGVSSK
jgi:anaerobic ribonucleoside-triphosphate reductase activating protein